MLWRATSCFKYAVVRRYGRIVTRTKGWRGVTGAGARCTELMRNLCGTLKNRRYGSFVLSPWGGYEKIIQRRPNRKLKVGWKFPKLLTALSLSHRKRVGETWNVMTSSIRDTFRW